MTAGTPLRRGWRAPAATALAALGTCSALGALSGVLATGPWVVRAVVAVALTALVTAGVRAVTRSAWLPTVAGLVLAGYGLLIAYTAPLDGLRLVPDGGSLERVGQLLTQAADLIEVSVVPMAVWPPVELLVVGASVVVFLAADLLAVGCGMPALTGVAFVAVWTPAVVIGYPGSTWALAGTGFAYLLLLAVGQVHVPPGGGSRRSTRRAGAVVAASAGLVAVTLVAGPVVAAVPAWSTLDLPDVGTGAAGPVRLSDDLDLRDSLREQSDQVVLRYTVDAEGTTAGDAGPTATAGLVGPLRSFTLRDFDGRSWAREPGESASDWDEATLLTSDPGLLGSAPDPGRGTLARVQVDVGALREDRLPVSTFPRTVSIDGGWRYDSGRDEVVGDRTDAGTRYGMVVQVPELTADLLRAADGDVPDEVAGYLDVPETDHADDLRALAADLTAGATTDYDRALALQSYFRDSTEFRYDTAIEAGTSDDAVWDFLESRRGYCVQYATSMTVLARTLGIPARLGVGFLPGQLGADRTYRITGADAHAWPELYFPGTGWVRFEPTPAVQTGPPPAWSNPYAASGSSAAPSAAAPSVGAAPSTAPSAGATAGAGAGSAGTTTSAPGTPGLVGLGAVVAVGAAAAAVWFLRRRPADRLTPELAWERLRGRLRRAGVGWSDAHTPRQAAAVVRARVAAVRGRPLGQDADRALSALAAAVEAERYAPRPGTVDAEELRGWVGAVLTDVSASGRREPAAPAAAASGA